MQTQMQPMYDADEIKAAQAAINLYPDDSGYWDSRTGQDTMEIVNACGLTPTNTDSERCRLYEAAIEAAFEQAEFNAA